MAAQRVLVPKRDIRDARRVLVLGAGWYLENGPSAPYQVSPWGSERGRHAILQLQGSSGLGL